jgi:hypothetical protein
MGGQHVGHAVVVQEREDRAAPVVLIVVAIHQLLLSPVDSLDVAFVFSPAERILGHLKRTGPFRFSQMGEAYVGEIAVDLEPAAPPDLAPARTELIEVDGLGHPPGGDLDDDQMGVCRGEVDEIPRTMPSCGCPTPTSMRSSGWARLMASRFRQRVTHHWPSIWKR